MHIIQLVLFLVFCASLLISVLMERSLLYKLKWSNGDLYRKVLGGQPYSWIEKGGLYLPSHIPISYRLYKVVMLREDTTLVSGKFRSLYFIAHWSFIIGFPLITIIEILKITLK